TDKFNSTNYNSWLAKSNDCPRFREPDYILDKSLPMTLPEGSSPEEHVTFEKLHKDNNK
ncbi:UNVERIFIED_CONTAM: hypothetical protein Sindi_2958100, partial [Sesamum indicum]